MQSTGKPLVQLSRLGGDGTKFFVGWCWGRIVVVD